MRNPTIMTSKLLLSSKRLPLSLIYGLWSGSLLPRHHCCRNSFFTLTFQYGESENVQNVTASFHSIVVGGRRLKR